MDVLRIKLHDQPASPLAGNLFIVLLNTPYKWICSNICCIQIGGVDCTNFVKDHTMIMHAHIVIIMLVASEYAKLRKDPSPDPKHQNKF